MLFCPTAEQVLVYFAVSKKGETPIDGITDANPEGLTSACGKWSEELKERLAGGGLTCHVLPEDRYLSCEGLSVSFLEDTSDSSHEELSDSSHEELSGYSHEEFSDSSHEAR